jgi:hypothetical protein
MADQQAGSPNAREVEYWNSAHTRAWADEHEAIDRLFAGLTQVALDLAAPTARTGSIWHPAASDLGNDLYFSRGRFWVRQNFFK